MEITPIDTAMEVKEVQIPLNISDVLASFIGW